MKDKTKGWANKHDFEIYVGDGEWKKITTLSAYHAWRESAARTTFNNTPIKHVKAHAL